MNTTICKMTNFVIHEFDPVIYPRKVLVAKGGEKKNIAELFEDADGDPYWLNNATVKNSYALTFEVADRKSGNYGVLVWMHTPKAASTGTLAHEADHAANFIFKSIDAKVDAENDEPHAYLVGWITECIEKVKKGKI